MRLQEDDCWARLTRSERGVLATVHPTRGVDAVPVVFALAERQIVMPIDTVKAKSGRRLQRLDNLQRDPRCVFLVDHYGDDWSRLWWVRVHGRALETDPTDELVAVLADRYPQYGAAGAVVGLIVLSADAITGWAAN